MFGCEQAAGSLTGDRGGNLSMQIYLASCDMIKVPRLSVSFPLVLWRIHDNFFNIRALDIKPIPQATNRNRILQAFVQLQQQGRAQYDTLMRIPLKHRLYILLVAIHNHTSDTSQLPSATDSIRRSTGLVAKAHVIRVLVVEGNPLRFARALNAREGHGAVDTVNSGEEYAGVTEGGFLFES